MSYREWEDSRLSCQALIHAAAVRHRHGIPASQYLEENTRLTRQLLTGSNGRCERFVLVSSISVFGWPRSLPITEKAPYAPVGPYGRSKVECEQIVREWGMPYAIVRPSITYGPGDTNGMVEKLLRLLRANKFRIVGSGRNRLQLVYVDDLSWAIAETALRPNLSGSEFICTYQDPISMIDLVRLAASAIGTTPPRFHAPIPLTRAAATLLEGLETLGLLRGEPLATHEKIDMITTDRAYDISHMREVLDWSPPTDYVVGLARTARALSPA
ncbi:SDR family oxidoreductase [soil metagenome]